MSGSVGIVAECIVNVVLHMPVFAFLQISYNLSPATSAGVGGARQKMSGPYRPYFDGAKTDASTAEGVLDSSDSISDAICPHTRGSFSIS